MPDPAVDVLIPTAGRVAALAATLAGLSAQTVPVRVVVSDRSADGAAAGACEVRSVAAVMGRRGSPVELVRHPVRRGPAEHRHALLGRARAPHVLLLDDDVLLEPDAVERLHRAILRAGCGFVGFGPIGMSHRDDERPAEQVLEVWRGPVTPELVTPDGPGWDRHRLHGAANLLHAAAALGLGPGDDVLYRVAWIGGCVMYDRRALLEAGGFGFWSELPAVHRGEDVLAQLRVMARSGGAGLLPSGAYHLEPPTTVPDRRADAPRVLPVIAAADGRSAG